MPQGPMPPVTREPASLPPPLRPAAGTIHPAAPTGLIPCAGLRHRGANHPIPVHAQFKGG